FPRNIMGCLAPPLRSVPSSQSFAAALWHFSEWPRCADRDPLGSVSSLDPVDLDPVGSVALACQLAKAPWPRPSRAARHSTAIGVFRFEFFFFEFRARENGEGMARRGRMGRDSYGAWMAEGGTRMDRGTPSILIN